MRLTFLGGPWHGRTLAVTPYIGGLWRVEVRVSRRRDGAPLPVAVQPLAIYVRREGDAGTCRYFLGFADVWRGE